MTNRQINGQSYDCEVKCGPPDMVLLWQWHTYSNKDNWKKLPDHVKMAQKRRIQEISWLILWLYLYDIKLDLWLVIIVIGLKLLDAIFMKPFWWIVLIKSKLKTNGSSINCRFHDSQQAPNSMPIYRRIMHAPNYAPLRFSSPPHPPHHPLPPPPPLLLLLVIIYVAFLVCIFQPFLCILCCPRYYRMNMQW